MEVIILLLLCGLLIGGPISSSSSSTQGSKKKKAEKELIKQQQQNQQLYRQNVNQQLLNDSPNELYNKPSRANETYNKNSVCSDFAVKNYEAIGRDLSNGGGEHLSSMLILMDNCGIYDRNQALQIIDRALRESGNAYDFGKKIDRALQ